MAEILGIISSAAGLVGFAVSTIPSLHQFRRDFKGTKHKQSWYLGRVQTIRTQLRTWKLTWHDATYEDRDYEYFWGASGCEEVKSKISLIRVDLVAIWRLLGCNDEFVPEVMTNTEWHDTRDYLQTEEATQIVHGHASLWKKFVFALFRGKELEETVQRLYDMVQDLQTYSEGKLADLQLYIPVGEKPDATALNRLITLRDWMETQDQIFTQLYHHSIDYGGWPLALVRPSVDLLDNLDTGLQTTFHIRRERQGAEPERDLGFVAFNSSTLLEASSWYNGLVDMPNLPHAMERQRLLTHFAELQHPDNNLSADIAEAAISLVTLTLLLWSNPWTDRVCICRLRLVTDGDSVRHVTLDCTANDTAGCPHRQHDRIRKALVLGRSLCELVLGGIVSDTDTDGVQSFLIGDHSKNTKGLLDEVLRKSRSHSYRQAVRHCFKYDYDLLDSREFRTTQILVLQENVIENLKKYRDGVRYRQSLG